MAEYKCSMDRPLPSHMRPTPNEAREALRRLFGFTRERFDQIEEQYRESRIDGGGLEWYYDPNEPKR